MNLPNKLSLFRIILIPVIMIVYAIPSLRMTPVFEGNDHLSLCNLIIIILAAIGAFTDLLDGKIARKHNLITDLGKFLDPLADKLLVTALLIILLDQFNYYAIRSGNTNDPLVLMQWWMVIVILARELMVTGIRLVAANKKEVIAASWYGKIKTTLQFITLLFLLTGSATLGVYPNNGGYNVYIVISLILIVATICITIFSGADYLIKNWHLLSENNQKGAKKKSK